MLSNRASRFVSLEFLFLTVLTLDGGTTSLPVGPRAPDAASGSSVDRLVYVDRDVEEMHWGEDGSSKYLNMGQDPKLATVDGSSLMEDKLKVNVLESVGDIFPKPASPVIENQRHLLWFGLGWGDKDEQERPSKTSAKTGTTDEADHQKDRLEREKGQIQEGDKGFYPEDDDLDDTEHMWHDDDHEDYPDDTDEENGFFFGGRPLEDGNHKGEGGDDEDVDGDEDDRHHDKNQQNVIHGAGKIYHTRGRIMKVAKNLLNEYQRKSLDIKEELTDDEGREKAAERFEADIDTEIDLLLKAAGDTKAGPPDGKDTEREEFLANMKDAKTAAKKRVKDILTGHNIHFDSDDL
ncbi:nonsense-mediated mRNA decay protein 2-like [Acanthaster planci]|uniref:Nonsense-mediated mRNA decay protein 2-like n=1 Tax=Acanthaster planci TaxID=133434 RepID=A0A8B7ZC56_ACAPL|nr:nonsense-mediated mRNA decay protein 2-like [Acanthaster planci]